MPVLKPFRGYRPRLELVADVAARPYDVLDLMEARDESRDNPFSLYRITKPEIEFHSQTDPYSPAIYERARKNFLSFLEDGILLQDAKPHFYIYAQRWRKKTQYGIVGCAWVEDYLNDRIKKHELTRPDKEEDRMKHVRILNANAEPVFFTYPENDRIDEIVAELVRAEPVYDFVTADGIGHQLWLVGNDVVIAELESLFAGMPAFYVADGHHRTAAAALVGKEKKENNPHHRGDEEYNFFMSVLFPASQLTIIDYNRVVKDLNGHSKEELLALLDKSFVVEEKGPKAYKPSRLHEFSMYIDHCWYALTAREGTYNDSDPIGVLDVTILSKLVLDEILGIKDLRTDQRIDFVGGIRGLPELKRRVDKGKMAVAFALYPVTMKQLMDIADTGNIMPPKTTWFEPKLRSGLVVHTLD